jgi:hypothetical protein
MGYIRGAGGKCLASAVREIIDTGAQTILAKTDYGTENIDRSLIKDMDRDIKITTSGSKS